MSSRSKTTEFAQNNNRPPSLEGGLCIHLQRDHSCITGRNLYPYIRLGPRSAVTGCCVMFDQQFGGNAQSIIQAVDHRCPRARLRSHPFNDCTGFGSLLSANHPRSLPSRNAVQVTCPAVCNPLCVGRDWAG